MLEGRRKAAASLLERHRDLLDARPDGGDVPLALADRGWSSYLLGLEDVDATEGSAEPVWPGGAPASLLDFTAEVRAACAIPGADHTGDARPPRRFETPRKHAQVDAFARIIEPIAKKADRVVDVGSGHGHLTRALADRLGMPVLGLERDAALAGKARVLAKDVAASFAVTDVLAGGLALSARDCVVGLHACGELGDAMVESAARAGASIALVGCCLQKRRAMSRMPFIQGAPELARAILGLSNLTPRDEGVETSRSENLRARERRVALHRLLDEAGVALPLGAEIEGLNRRVAHAELDVLVARAFDRRALPHPSRFAIDAAERWAVEAHGRMRRLALPRALLGRLLEVFVLLDRARHLELHGFRVEIGVLFPAAASARNLILVAAI